MRFTVFATILALTSAPVAAQVVQERPAMQASIDALASRMTATEGAVATATAADQSLSTRIDAKVSTVNGVTPIAGAVTLPTVTYVPGFTNTSPGLLANLYATAPCTAARVNQFATINDLYGQLTDSVRCTNFGSWGYGWRATIPFYAATQAVTGGTVTIACNVTPPVLRLSGNLTSSLAVAFTSTGCTPGQRQEVQMDITLGLYTAVANGLVGTVATKAIGATSTSLYVFDTAGWRPY